MIPESGLSELAMENLNRAAFTWRALCYSFLNEFEKAKMNLDKYDDLMSKREDIYQGWFGPYINGLICLGNDDTENALKSLNKALEISPNAVLINYELGKIYETTGDLGKAKIHYNKVKNYNFLSLMSAWVRPYALERLAELE